MILIMKDKHKDKDMNRQDLIDWAKKNDVKGFSYSHFAVNFSRFCEDYGLKDELFYKNITYKDEDRKQDEYEFEKGTGFKIKKEWRETFLTLFYSYHKNPFIKSGYYIGNVNMEAKNVDEYYNLIIDEVEEMADNEEKYSIAYSGVYFRTRTESHVIKMVKEKMNELSAAISLIEFGGKSELWSRLYEVLDELVRDCYNIDIDIKRNHRDELKKVEEKYRSLIKHKYSEMIRKQNDKNSNAEKYESRHIELLKRSMLTELLCIESEILKENFQYTNEKNLSDFLVEKLRKRMIQFPVKDNHEYDNPNTTQQNLEELESRHRDSLEIFKDKENEIKKINQTIGKGFDLKEEVSLFKEKLLREQNEELMNRIKELDNIEDNRRWAERLLKDKHNKEEPLSEDHTQWLKGLLSFLDKVERESKKENRRNIMKILNY